MARFSQMMLRGMLDPSRREAYSQVGRSIGQIPGFMALNRDAEAKQEETQRLLQENANNPARLQQLAQEYLAKGDKEAAEAFTNAATQATARRTAQVGALEQGGADIQKEAQRKRAMQVAMQDNNERALVALRAGALDPVEYLSRRATEKPEPTQFDYTEKTVMRDGKPVVVQFGISKTDPSVTTERVLGPAEPKEGGTTDKKSLNDLITEAGLDPQDYDITTLEGLKKLRSFVVTDVQNASLANTVSDMIKEMTPPGVQEAITILRDIDPKFVAAEADLERVERFKALTSLSEEDVSGLRNVIERVVSGTTESDIKAVQELQAFRGNKDIINKLKDFALGITSGRLSEETVQEYGSIMEILGALANQRQMNTINNLIINGSPREIEAALKAKTFYSGSEQARIL